MKKSNSSNALNKEFLHRSCSVNEAIDLISGRWKALIIIYIHEGQNRFSLLKNILSPISDQILGRQLKDLEQNGLISKTIIAEVPVRVDYELTAKGKSLLSIFDSLEEWVAS